MKTPDVSVVVPCYNEAENVPLLFERIDAVFAGLAESCEILFVNDGSTDGTRAAMDALAAAHPHFRPLHLVRNCGQSAAVVAGMRRARGKYILTLDGDLQNDPCDFPRFLELLRDHDCVCGYRAERNDTWVRKVSSRVGNAVRNAVLRDGIRDSGCGSKGFRRACPTSPRSTASTASSPCSSAARASASSSAPSPTTRASMACRSTA
ncbi:MAG TPA: glycosyltransferase family 2 protein [Candidatus Hydrogenedentes bacterium]|nr:glycosyltransferase family 2 protein [Candidatus Hydrogenedentota bacterium]